jgi:hypothetical protein
VHLFGDRTTADEVHNQSFLLPDTPTPLALQASGDPTVLGEQAAPLVRVVHRPTGAPLRVAVRADR